MPQSKGKGRGKPRKISWVMVPRGMPGAGTVEVRRLSLTGAMTTTAAGTFAKNIAAATAGWGLSSTTEWSSYSARFTEYRVLAIKVTVVPYTVSASSEASMVLSTDRSGAVGAPANLNVCWAGTAPRVFFTGQVKPGSYEAKAIDLEDQDYSPVGTIISTFSVQAFATGPVSTQLFGAYVEYLVEFKGPQ